MRVAIDASNLSIGGGVTHLIELLREADPILHGFEKILVWASSTTLARIEERPWIDKRTDPALEGHLLKRLAWQRQILPRHLREAKVDLLFSPGGSIVPKFRPAVTMSRNMLPFEWGELRRFGCSSVTLKLALLRLSQSNSFKRADGTIFLTHYAFNAVQRVTGPLRGRTAIIPHGVDVRFRLAPRHQRTADEFTASNPLRVVYVSTVDAFKHQWQVVDAIGQLHQEGLPLRLDLYGSARPSTLPLLTEALTRVDNESQYIRYWGAVDYKEIHKCYAAADICVFASSCENMPNILIESMAAGLPIACSNRGPMPEVLGDAGVYFNPENATSIANAVRELAIQPQRRAETASAAFVAASKFSWSRCTNETFSFLRTVMQEHQKRATKSEL